MPSAKKPPDLNPRQTLYTAAFARPDTVLAYHRAHNGADAPAATDWDGAGSRVVQFSVPVIAPQIVRRALRGLDRIHVVEHQQLRWQDDGGFVVDGTPVLEAPGAATLKTAARVVATPAGDAATRLTSTIAVSAGGPRWLAAAVEGAMVAQAADAAAAYVSACASAATEAAGAPPPPKPRVVMGGDKTDTPTPFDADGDAFVDALETAPLAAADAEAILAALDRLHDRAADLARDVAAARRIVWAACPAAAPPVGKRVVESVDAVSFAWCAAGVAVAAAVVAVVASRRVA